MSNPTEVYDLGSVEVGTRAPRTVQGPPTVIRRIKNAPTAANGATGFGAGAAASAAGAFDISGNLSLFLPGAGQLARGERANGLFFLSSLGLVAALGWATIETSERLPGTLEALGLPPETGVWFLGLLFVWAAILHVGNLAGRGVGTEPPASPWIAGGLSLFVPGWGQLINGDRARAAVFVAGLWVVGAAWLLVAPPVTALFEAQGLHLPPPLETFASPLVRFTAPAVVWALAVYDAASRAAHRRAP